MQYNDLLLLKEKHNSNLYENRRLLYDSGLAINRQIRLTDDGREFIVARKRTGKMRNKGMICGRNNDHIAQIEASIFAA